MMTGTSGRSSLTLGSISRPLMPGMLISDRIRISDCSMGAGNARQRVGRRQGKVHRETLRAQVAPEMLTKQRLDVGFVVDNQNQNVHV